jgi:cyanophycinase
MGLDHYRAIGLRPEVLPLRTRDDADRADIVAALDGARVVFFSGGNPGYLAETLDGTRFWTELTSAWRAGRTALGGCSAGAVFIGAMAPYVAEDSLRNWVPGLKLLSRAFILPHFDALETYATGLRKTFLGARPDGAVAVGIDENTAMMGDGSSWTVEGAGSVWTGVDDELLAHPQGTSFDLDLR